MTVKFVLSPHLIKNGKQIVEVQIGEKLIRQNKLKSVSHAGGLGC